MRGNALPLTEEQLALVRAAASANFARRTPRHSRTLRSTTAAAMPALSNMDLQRAAA